MAPRAATKYFRLAVPIWRHLVPAFRIQHVWQCMANIVIAVFAMYALPRSL